MWGLSGCGDVGNEAELGNLSGCGSGGNAGTEQMQVLERIRDMVTEADAGMQDASNGADVGCRHS